ncbi:MAG: PP2C family protein-serine/threonine phosphatase [Myxococcota bacterium]
MDVGSLLKNEIERMGLRDGPPDPESWRIFLRKMDTLLIERESRIETLEELAAYSTGELSRVRQTLARGYADVVEMLDVMTRAVRVFQTAANSRQASLEDALRAARHQFSVQLNATWFSHPIPEDTADFEMAASSMQTLHQSLRNLGRVMTELVEEAASAATGRKELELAGAVQKMLVPPEQVSIPGLNLYSWFQPAAHCGGDWWSAHALSERDGMVIVGDVTGHGAPSAIITGAVKGACDLARMGMRGALRPGQLMRMLNRVIHESARGEYMMTGVVVRISAGGGRGVVANAGHRPPLIVRGGQVQVLQGVRDPPLGSAEGSTYSELEFAANPGDLLVLYTDGIPETEAADGTELGEKALRALALEGSVRGARALRDHVRSTVLAHRADRPQRDDICLVVAEIV